VIPNFYPSEFFGGPVTIAFNVAKELVRRGHEVVVYTSDAKDLSHRLLVAEDNIDGVRIKYFKNLSMWFVKFSKLFITLQMNSELKDCLREFDIVHAHEYTTYQNILVHKFSKKYGVPYVLQAHGSLSPIGRKARQSLFDTLFGESILKDASKVIALTETELSQYREAGVSLDRISVIPNGINSEEYSNLPSKNSFKSKFHIPFQKKVILYLGRIHSSKGIGLLIDAFYLLISMYGFRNAFLVVAGPDDGFLQEAKTKVKNLGIKNNVLFTGFIDAQDKMAALVDADVFVTPSFSGFPMTFLEACIAGTPIITTTLGDRMDWINNQVGLISAPSSNNLSEAMNRILSNDRLLEDFSSRCKGIVTSAFSLGFVVSKLENLYAEAIKNTCLRKIDALGVEK